jgi:hypothetical protein
MGILSLFWNPFRVPRFRPGTRFGAQRWGAFGAGGVGFTGGGGIVCRRRGVRSTPCGALQPGRPALATTTRNTLNNRIIFSSR